MALRRLQVTDFRCLQTAELQLDPLFTLISGANGSGKTSVLEAIYVLGRGRSFRTRRLEHLIRKGASRFVAFGEVQGSGSPLPLGVEGSAAGVRARISGAPASSLAELAVSLPVQIIDPEVHKLIEEGPVRRRRFLDWGVFHVEQAFMDAWQNFQQVLRQRNAALKARQPRMAVAVWDRDFIRYAEAMTVARSTYVDRLAGPAAALASGLLGQELGLRYRTGWNRDLSLAEALEQSWIHDLERGATQVGPHRAELAVTLDAAPAKDRVSRGQQKLLAASLLMSQLQLFPADAAVRPTLLLDDPAAELDQMHLEALIAAVSGQGCQLVVTTLQPEFSAFGKPGRRYQLREGACESL